MLRCDSLLLDISRHFEGSLCLQIQFQASQGQQPLGGVGFVMRTPDDVR